MKSQDLKKIDLPDSPGVYKLLSKGQILYIGKATSLKDRVASYFAKDLINTRGPHIVDMVFKSDTVEFEVTDSALEALLLENVLIKKHKPHYNTKEKDDKSFNYICITDELWPRVLIIRARNLSTINYKLSTKFGPFPSGSLLREAMKIIRRLFPYMDDSSLKKDNQEFYRQLGLMPDSSDSQALKIYQENIKNLISFLNGNKRKVIKSLTSRMNALAKEKRFEEASIIRNKIFSLGHINDVALIRSDFLDTSDRPEARSQKLVARIEAYDVAHLSGKQMVGVMVVVEGGKAKKSDYKKFIIRTQKDANDTGALREILERRLKHTDWGTPDIVAVDGSTAQIRVAREVLKDNNVFAKVVSVVKDGNHKPKGFKGDVQVAKEFKDAILLANSEAHRFSITFHRKKLRKNFLEI